MELEELKAEWQRHNNMIYDKKRSSDSITVREKSWFIRNRIAIDGVICIVAALLLVSLLLVQVKEVGKEINPTIYIFGVIIGLYAFVKGIFTILYFRTSSKLDNEVHKFIIDNLKNQLYFVYEQMFWLWVLLPFILVVLPVIVVRFMPTIKDFYNIYYVSFGMLYLITLFVFSRILCRKKRKILSEIKKIEEK